MKSYSNTTFVSLNTLLIMSLLTLFFSTSIHAEIYQWTDESGQVHFGDRPPNQKQATNISNTVKNVNVTSNPSTPEMMLKHEQLIESERAKQYQHLKEQEILDQVLSKACQEAKTALYTLKGPVYFVDEQGNEVKVSEAERKQQAAALEKEIRKHCK